MAATVSDFGVKASALTGLRIYEQASRGSGRTETILRSLKDGDVLVAKDERDARRLERECNDRKVSIRLTTIGALRHGSAINIDGCLVFDHTAVLAMYEEAIESVELEIAAYGAAIVPERDVRPVAAQAWLDR